jgi:hypothetical protein
MNMRTLLISYLLLPALLIPALYAQETVAPTTNEPVGPVRGEDKGDYNVVQSWELGYRYHLVGGDDGKYRSDVNYRNGVRLLSSYLTVNSKDGHGKLYDEIVLNTQGLGGDPYESVILRVQKNGLYRYDMMWRSNDYYNPGLATAGGLHLEDLTQRWQDHDVVLFPQGKIRIKLGYSRNNEDGPALSTTNLFENQRGDIFTLFSNVKREYNSYRIGADLDYYGFRLSFLRRWEFYKEDTPYTLAAPGAGLNPNDGTTLSSFNRAAPIHGETPGWLVNLSTDKKYFAVHGRFAYTGGNRNFVQNESAVGTGLLGTENRLVIAFGDAKRPVTSGDLNVSFFPTEKISITNNTSVDNTRIEGNSFYEQFDLASLTATVLNFQFLGIRLVTNSTDVHYHLNKKVDFFTGYRFADREIRSIQSTTDPTTPFTNQLYTQSNTLQAGVAGVNWIITGPLRLRLETEVGRNDNPFTIVADKNYHVINGRLQYKRKSFMASAGYKQTYNNDSLTLTSYSSHSRNYFANASWAARDWLSIDAGYSKLHLDTLGGLSFFAGLPRATLQTGNSLYVSNIHAANLGVRFALKKRADLYVGYNITRDTGDGRSALETPGTVDALLYNVQTFPLNFQSPLIRLTIPLTKKIKWNAGYQYYGYHEDFGLNSLLQNYHAHTGYTSVLWAF